MVGGAYSDQLLHKCMLLDTKGGLDKDYKLILQKSNVSGCAAYSLSPLMGCCHCDISPSEGESETYPIGDPGAGQCLGYSSE